MKRTIDTEPEFFWYYNNGITIVCDQAEQVSRSGNQVLRLVNPQVINGQQTTRTLHRSAGKSNKATVLVRVISVPRESESDSERFENLVSKIVAATNWQNAILPSDLMANDRRQIELERKLRKLDYLYIRKRQSKGEAIRNAGVKYRFIIKKEELAQVVAACDLDPLIVREGKEQLFEESHYETVFPKSDPDYYLPRYWLARHVTNAAHGFPVRAYAKWLVMHFLWLWLSPVINAKSMKRVFVVESEKYLWGTLLNVIDVVYRGAIAYFRANRGTGAAQLDPSTFFKRSGHHVEFDNYWAGSFNRERERFAKRWDVFTTELKQIANE